MSNPLVWFLFNRPRQQRLRQTRQGQWPGEGLYGFLSLRDRGFDAQFSDLGHEPSLLRSSSKVLEDLISDRGRKVGFNLAQAWTLRKELARADLIFATADSSALGVLAMKDAGLIKTPIVYSTIGLAAGFSKTKGLHLRYYKRLLRLAECIVYYGEGEGDLLKDAFDVPADRLRFVPFCVEADFFGLENNRDGPALAVGLDHRRDWKLLFEAVRAIGIPLDLICNRDLLVGLSIPDSVQVLDPVSMVDLREKLSRARFVVLPVRQNPYTGATITLLQSMAAGCATIVSNTRAIESGYALEQEKNVLLVPPGDLGALADAMRRLDGDDALRNQLGLQARKTVRSKHDLALLADNLTLLFREVLA